MMLDCRTTSEAAVLPPASVMPADLGDFKVKLTFSLASSHENAASSIQQGQKKYKKDYDCRMIEEEYQVAWGLSTGKVPS